MRGWKNTAVGCLLLALALLSSSLLAQNVVDDPQKIESRRQDGLTALTPGKLTATHAIGDSTWSPDGSRIAFAGEFGGQQNLWLIPASGGWPTQLTVSERRQRRPAWSPSGKFIAYESDPAGDGVSDVFIVKVENGEVTNLSNSPAVSERDAAWSPNSRYLAWSAQTANGTAEIESYDMLLRRRRVLTENAPAGGHNARPLWSPDEKSIAYTQFSREAGSSIFVAEVATGKSINLTPHEGAQLWSASAWSPDGTELLISTSDGKAETHVALLEVKSRKVTPLSHATGRPGQFSPDGRLITWSASADGNTPRLIYDRATGTSTEVAPPTGLAHWGGNLTAFSRDGAKLLWRGESAQSPAGLYVYDLAGKKSTPLSPALVGGLRTEEMVAPVLVRYSFEDKPARALVYVPYNQIKNGRAPIVVYAGSGRGLRNGFDPVVQFLVNLGYFVIAPELPAADTMAARRLLAAAGWLKTNPYVDGKKLIVMGADRGARLALEALAAGPQLWSAGLIVGPWPQTQAEAQPVPPLALGLGLGTQAPATSAMPSSAQTGRTATDLLSAPLEQVKAPVLLAGGRVLEPVAARLKANGSKVEVASYANGSRSNRADVAGQPEH